MTFSKLETRITLILLATLLFVFGISASAQLSGKGEIVGRVTDPTGAVVSGATVVATSTTRGTKVTTKTTSAGDYAVSPLDADTYTVTVTAKGFKMTTQDNVVVNALEVATVDVGLTLGSESETVTVTEVAEQLQTSNATLGATMAQETYSELPIAMGAGGQPDQRRASDYVLLMPGVQNNETNNNVTDNTGPIDGSGSKGGASSVYIEGIPFFNVSQEGDNRFIWTAISVDSVNQLQVQTTGYPALYEGQGVQNFDLKRGSNSYHGAVYEYFRNTALDTWGFYAPALLSPVTGTAIKPAEHMNEYGIVLGGPIIKNKLFIFGNYDGYRYAKGVVPTLQAYPTMAERQGDFSALGVDIYDPSTGSDASTRTQFMGCDGMSPNKICPTEFSQVASNINNLLPPASMYANQNPGNNFLAGLPFGLSNFTATGRVDYAMSDKHNMSIIIAAGRQAAIGPAAQTTTGRNNGPLPFNYGQGYAPKTKTDIFEDTYTINAHMVNQFKYGFARYYSPSFNLGNNNPAWSATTLGITGVPAGQASTSFPEVTFAGTDAPFQWGGDVGSKKISNAYYLIDNYQWDFGKHLLTFGAQVAWLQYQYTLDSGGSSPMILAANTPETAGYSSGTTINPGTGLAYASFLVGQIDAGSLTQNAVQETGARFRPISPYVQDDWKISHKLTLNLGLRYDYFPTYREAHNVLSFFNPTMTNAAGTMGVLQFSGNGADTCNCSTPVNDYKKQFGPRLGLAYQALPNTVFRASWGVMYTHGNGVAGSAISQNGTGILGFQASPKTSSTNGVAQYSLDSPYPAYNPPAGVASGPNYALGFSTISPYTGSPQSVVYGDPYYGGRAPQYIDYNFGVQQQIARNLVLSISYVGSEGHFESPDSSTARGVWINQLSPQYLFLGSILSTDVKNLTPTQQATLASAGITLPANFNVSQTVAQALEPFPNYKGVTDAYGNVANSNYNSLQVTVAERAYKGLSFMFNYIWSKAIDDGGTFRSGYAIPAAYSNDGRAWAADRIERGVSTTNQPHHVIETGVWALPFGAQGLGGGNSVVRALASNFKFSEIVQIYSGSPLAITGSACQVNPAQSTCNPTIAPGFAGPGRINGSWGQGATATSSPSYLNANAFVPISTLTASGSPYAYTFGDAARTAPFGMYGPGNYDIDISLRRNFAMTERAHLTLEGDLYNLTNHTQFLVGGTAFGSASFGTVSGQANSSRDAQLSLRLEF
jgi:Carboxypeptidase regulatory-like domain/TonB dependent receptor